MDALTIPAAPPQSRLSPSWRGHRQSGACSAACVRHAAWRALPVICLLAWMLSRWRPGRIAPPRQVRDLLVFGANITVANLATYFGQNVDKI